MIVVVDVDVGVDEIGVNNKFNDCRSISYLLDKSMFSLAYLSRQLQLKEHTKNQNKTL